MLLAKQHTTQSVSKLLVSFTLSYGAAATQIILQDTLLFSRTLHHLDENGLCHQLCGLSFQACEDLNVEAAGDRKVIWHHAGPGIE